jgi:hypothetical protein
VIDIVNVSTRRSDLLTAATLCLALTACGEAAGGPADAFTVRDSAGILIAESRAPAWDEGEGWRLADDPELEIGMMEGPEEYLLTGVTSALRDDDGTVLVANAGSGEIRVYDAGGSYVRSIGQLGEGPGEFRGISWIRRIQGDTLVAFDISTRRISIFTPGGEFVRSHTLDGYEIYPVALPALRDGSLIIQLRDMGLDPLAGDGLRSGSEVFLHASPSGEPLDTLALMPLQMYQVTRQVTGGVSATAGPPRFGAQTVVAIAGDRVALARSDHYELLIHGPHGGIERIVRREIAPRPVTEELLAAADREARERVEAEERSVRREMMEQMSKRPHADTLPFFQRILPDTEGNLWVEGYEAPGEAPAPWTVFDREGRMLGSVPFPDRFLPTQIGEDFVLGVAMDELDVQRVRLYPLRKD